MSTSRPPTSRTAQGRSLPLYILSGLLVAAGFWLLESSLHTWVFADHASFRDALLPHDPNELWMRLIVVALLMTLAVFSQATLAGSRTVRRTISTILEHTTDAYLSVDEQWRLRYLNSQAEALFDIERDVALGQNLWDAIPEAASFFYKPLHRVMGKRVPAVVEGTYAVTGRILEMHAFPTEFGLAFYCRDITSQKNRERSLRESNRRHETILSSAVDGIITINRRGIIETFNPAAERIFGYRAEEVIGHNVAMLMPPHRAEYHDEYINNYLHSGKAQIIGIGPRETTAQTRDGEHIPIDLAISEMQLDDEIYFVGVVRDITERKRSQEALEYMSNFDSLTGLPNRSLLRDRLNHALHQAHRKEQLVAVMFLDLDRFKTINDSLGHAVGDQLLKTAAERLKGCVREGDTVARLGGDEFIILLEGITHVDNAAHVAQKILDALNQPMMLKGYEVFVSCSIGITIYPFDDDNIDDLLKDADTAMYRAKEKGRNGYEYFTSDMTSDALEHMNLERDLRYALDAEEFELYYQPQLDLHSQQVVGLEALLRWHHPERGLIPPAQFIPLLEETGLILPVGEWVLRTACEQMQSWQQAGLPKLKVAVNLSAWQFRQKELATRVDHLLKATGIDADCLELEITESVLVDNIEQTRNTLESLHRMGVRLSIDDFGTGYSSMNYLKRFPLHTLKIDQSFIRDVTHDADNAAITQAIIALAKNLRLRVIAEGVETEEQRNFLRQEGCDEIQGYLICQPQPAEKIIQWLQESEETTLIAKAQ